MVSNVCSGEGENVRDGDELGNCEVKTSTYSLIVRSLLWVGVSNFFLIQIKQVPTWQLVLRSFIGST